MNTNTEEFVWYCWIRAYNALEGKRRTNNKWATTWQNRQNECSPTQRRLRSAWASAQSDQSLRCPHEECLVLSYPLSALRRLWSDWVDAQADLSLHWAHTHSVGFVMSRLKLKFILSRCANDKSFIARKPEVHSILLVLKKLLKNVTVWIFNFISVS